MTLKKKRGGNYFNILQNSKSCLSFNSTSCPPSVTVWIKRLNLYVCELFLVDINDLNFYPANFNTTKAFKKVAASNRRSLLSHLFHLGSAEGRGQDAPHPLPAFIPQHEQAVCHGLGGKANSLHREKGENKNICTYVIIKPWRESTKCTWECFLSCPHHSVWEAAEVPDHHLSEHVRVRYHHHRSPAQIIPEIYQMELILMLPPWVFTKEV